MAFGQTHEFAGLHCGHRLMQQCRAARGTKAIPTGLVDQADVNMQPVAGLVLEGLRDECCVNTVGPRKAADQAPQPSRGDVTGLRPPVPRTRQAMERVAELYLSGAVRPPEIKLYRLSQAAEAHRVSEGRHFRGKLVFQVR